MGDKVDEKLALFAGSIVIYYTNTLLLLYIFRFCISLFSHS